MKKTNLVVSALLLQLLPAQLVASHQDAPKVPEWPNARAIVYALPDGAAPLCPAAPKKAASNGHDAQDAAVPGGHALDFSKIDAENNFDPEDQVVPILEDKQKRS